MRIVMTCGGTGGHIYPAIAIANKIKEEHPHAEITFIGTGRPLEKKAIPEAGYKLEVISSSGFHRKKIYRNYKTIWDLIKGMAQASRIIKDIKPVAVIATGGYVCVPVITKAYQMGIKTYIQEQNAMPGMANRWLASKADKIFLGFEEAKPYFKDSKKVYVTGNPIRKSFGRISKEEALSKLSIEEGKFTLLIFGGSLGSAMINKATLEGMSLLLEDDDISICFVTGSSYYESILKELSEKEIPENSNFKIMEYAHNMEVLLGAADLVVSRAGALTLAEESLVGIPAILIPSPNVTGNHQYHNAKAFSDKGGAIMLEEKHLSGQRLAAEIIALKNDSKKLLIMKKNIKKLASGQGADLIYEQLDLLKNKKGSG